MILTLIGAAQADADAAQASANAIVGGCGTLVPAVTCPLGAGEGPNCNDIPVGSFCEADGECGTSPTLDNCGVFDWYFRAGN